MADLNPHPKTDPAVVEADWEVLNIAPATPTQSEQPMPSVTYDWLEKLLQEITEETSEEFANPFSDRFVNQRKRCGIILFSWNGGSSYTANLNIK